MNKKKTKIKVDNEWTTFTYVYLHRNARFALDLAEETAEARLYHYMNSIIMSAFALEAYINHLCAEELPFWKEIERLSPQKKLNIICSYLNFNLDKSQRPFQSFKQIFRIRNSLAHGRTETTHRNNEIELAGQTDFHKYKKTEWELACTKEGAERFFNDMTEMIEKLHTHTGQKLPAFGMFGKGSGSSTVIHSDD